MSESKKVLYKRATASDSLLELMNRITFMDTDYDVPIEIKDVIIYGSYAKGAKKVHDLDVFINGIEHREEYPNFLLLHGKNPQYTVANCSFVFDCMARYFKGNSKLISIHCNMSGQADDGELEIALSEDHYYLLKDGKLNYDAIDELLSM